MFRKLYLFLALFAVSACNTNTATNEVESPASAARDAAAVTSDAKRNILAQNEASHVFSDPAAQDRFSIRLLGGSIMTATAVLEIKSSTGTTIYQQKFESLYLVDRGFDVPNATPQQMEEQILKRVKSFFAEEHFKTPAIPAGQVYEAAYADAAVWKAIQADPTAVGFVYVLGKEDGRHIAYSKAQQQVVLYYNCC